MNNITEKNEKGFNDYFIYGLLIALFAIEYIPNFRSIEIIGPQYLYLSILNLICIAYIFVNKSKINPQFLPALKKTKHIVVYAIFVLLSALSGLGANNFSLWVVNFSHVFIILILALNLAILLFNKKEILPNLVFFVCVSLFVSTFTEVYHLFKNLNKMSLFQIIPNFKGNSGNINIFSVSINIKIPFLVFAILCFDNWKKYFAIVTLFCATLVVFLISARASYLGLFLIVVSFLVLYNYKYVDNVKEKIFNSLFVVVPIILSLLLTNVIFSTKKGEGRFESVGSRVTKLADSKVEDQSINLRKYYWKNSILVIKAHPLLGVGIGNWRIESLPYEQLEADNLLISEHSHNDFLEIMAETGIVNGLVYLLLFILIVIINIKTILKSTDRTKQTIAIISILMLTGYLADCLFNFPLHRTAIQMWFAFIMVFTLVNNHENVTDSQKSITNIPYILATLLCLGATFISYSSFEAYRLENDITADIQGGKDFLTSQDIKNRMPFCPNVFTNSEPFSEQLGIYLVKEKKYDEAQKYLNIANTINPHNGRVEWYKHRIANENNKKDSAYIYAKQAFKIRPRNYDYYLSVLFMANEFKDTTEMLNVHKIYDGYVKKPKNWIDTSNALHLSNYNKKNILNFINEGVKLYPQDSALLERKKVFEYELGALNPNAKFKTSNTKPVTTTEKYIDYLQRAVNYGTEGRFDKSMECYEQVRKIDPNNITVTQNIGICYFKLNKFQQAINELEKTLGAPNLNDGKTEYILGISYLNIKNTANGCKYLNIATTKKFPGAEATKKQYCK